jgi:hypothetical protein
MYRVKKEGKVNRGAINLKENASLFLLHLEHNNQKLYVSDVNVNL